MYGNPDNNGNIGAHVEAGEAHIGSVTGNTIIVSGGFTRPADTTPYNIDDLVANSTTAGSVNPIILAVSRVIDKPVTLRRFRLKKSGISISNALFRAHIYRLPPVVSNGDNGAWVTTESEYAGWVDITMDKVFSDGAKGFGTPAVGSEIIMRPNAGTLNICVLLQARANYVPGNAEEFVFTAEGFQD